MMGRPIRDSLDRFFEQTIPQPNGCWVWVGHREANGYGRLLVHDGAKWKHALAHRFAYENAFGSIPDGKMLDHICRMRCCVNPDHLRPVTARENILCGEGLAAINARKTHCPKGHEYSPENTQRKAGNRRACRECGRQEVRARRARGGGR